MKVWVPPFEKEDCDWLKEVSGIGVRGRREYLVMLLKKLRVI
jgi:hypothetical protein